MIRPANPDDAALLSEVGARIFRDTFSSTNTAEDMALYLAGAFSPRRQRAEITTPGARTLLAFDEAGALIAYSQLFTDVVPDSVRSPKPVEVGRFYVDHAWHGRGVAQTLMQATLAEAEALGGQSVWLSVWEHNQRALAFYRRSGFEVVGSHPFILGTDVQTDLLLVRPHLLR